jgi:hypothetical protein
LLLGAVALIVIVTLPAIKSKREEAFQEADRPCARLRKRAPRAPVPQLSDRR